MASHTLAKLNPLTLGVKYVYCCMAPAYCQYNIHEPTDALITALDKPSVDPISSAVVMAMETNHSVPISLADYEHCQYRIVEHVCDH